MGIGDGQGRKYAKMKGWDCKLDRRLMGGDASIGNGVYQKIWYPLGRHFPCLTLWERVALILWTAVTALIVFYVLLSVKEVREA